MAVETGVTPSLEPEVPKIIITEPSPYDRSSSRMSTQCASEEPHEPPRETTQAPATVTPVVPEQTSDPMDNDSSNEYNPAQESAQCVVPVEEPPLTVITVNVDEESGASDSDQVDYSRRSSYGRFLRFCYRCLKMADNNYWLLLYIPLMALPIFAGYVGFIYLNDCTASPGTPAVLLFTGISGVILIIVRPLLVIQRSNHAEGHENICLVFTQIFAVAFTLILFLAELLLFWRYTPSFDDVNALHFCDPTFYLYTYWFNWTTIGLALFVCIKEIASWRIYRTDTYHYC